MKSLAAAVMLPLWGGLIDKSGINNTLIMMSLFILVLGVTGIWAYSKFKHVTI